MIKNHSMYVTYFIILFFYTSINGLAQSSDSNFRVFPYLQLSEQGTYILTWFGKTEGISDISVLVDDSLMYQQKSIIGERLKELEYVPFETLQVIPGLQPGSWLISGHPVRYRVELSDLPASTIITYQVTLQGEVYKQSFRSSPTRDHWTRIRFIALADSETEPLGRVLKREWEPGLIGEGIRPETDLSLWSQKFGVSSVAGRLVLRYALTEQQGYQENLKIINSRNPDFMLMPGDLVQGGGYQPGWDEFFHHNAGKYDNGLSNYPILPALGNWENFGGSNGGYGLTQEGRFAPKIGRDKFFSYFNMGGFTPDNRRKPFYRVNYGPITILTLDSSIGVPDDSRSNYSIENKLSGNEFISPGTDTQENFTLNQYASFGGNDLFPFNEGLEQWNWVEQELALAQEAGQLIFVQFHHAPYSSGEHCFPMNHTLSTGQGGTPMRIYQPLFEKFGVIAVFSGHNEMFERSFVDLDGDGKGVYYYDVGVAGDGLRGERKMGVPATLTLVKYNPFQQWSADQFEPEVWQTIGGVLQLTSGGKHYGHLEVNVEKIVKSQGIYANIKLSPVHIFPILNESYELIRTERRIYNDQVTLEVKLRDLEDEIPLIPEIRDSILLFLNEKGNATLEKEQILKGKEGVSEEFNFSISQLQYDCGHLGENSVELNIFWKDSLVQTKLINVTVLDTISPKIILKDSKVVALSLFQLEKPLNLEDVLIDAEDNCGIEKIEMSHSKFDCKDLGTIEVVVKAQDFSGNVSEGRILIFVEWEIIQKTISASELTFCDQTILTVDLPDLVFDKVQWYRNGELVEGLLGPMVEVSEAGD